MNKRERLLIPMVRNVVPNMIAEELASVQPMPNIDIEKLGKEMEAFFNIRPTKHFRPRFGTIVHSMFGGWQICDGRKLVSVEEFFERFPDINY